ncbi:MAG: hypothetical protein ACP5FZ_03990 [Fidelibacterota bacterium]
MITKESAIRINIRKINGQLVQTLCDGVRSPGKHRIQWDAAALSSGIYFCELMVDQSRAIQKMIMLK